MSDTNFIVISGKPSTNETVRNIVCETCASKSVTVSYGVVTNKGGYAYNRKGEDRKNDNLSNGLNNHISQFISDIGMSAQTARLNLFFLDNPYGENDFDQSSYKELLKLKSEKFNALTVWHVILGYDMAKPEDVNLLTDEMALAKAFSAAGDSSGNNTLYISTSNLKGGAVFESKEHHDFALPRALANFMLLVSTPATSASIVNAATPSNVNTSVFSIGHAECIYYAPDIQRLQNLYLKLALIDVRLNGSRPTAGKFKVDLDTAGLNKLMCEVQSRMSQIGCAPDATDDDLMDSADRLVSSSFFRSYFGKDNLGNTLPLGESFISNEDLKTTEAECVSETWPSRKEELKAKLECLRKGYESQLKKVVSGNFSVRLNNDSETFAEESEKTTQKIGKLRKQLSNCSCWDSLTGKKKKLEEELSAEESHANSLSTQISNVEKAKKAVDDIRFIDEVIGGKYAALRDRIDSLEAEKRSIMSEIDNFQLKTFRNTLSFINLDKARAHFQKRLSFYEEKLDNLCNGRTPEAALANLRTEMEHLYDNMYDAENGHRPYDFIIDMENSLGDLYKNLTDQSLPYVNDSENEKKLFDKQQVFIFSNNDKYVQPNLREMSGPYQAIKVEILRDSVCAIQVSAINPSTIEQLTGENTQQANPDSEEVRELPDGMRRLTCGAEDADIVDTEVVDEADDHAEPEEAETEPSEDENKPGKQDNKPDGKSSSDTLKDVAKGVGGILGTLFGGLGGSK